MEEGGVDPYHLSSNEPISKYLFFDAYGSFFCNQYESKRKRTNESCLPYRRVVQFLSPEKIDWSVADDSFAGSTVGETIAHLLCRVPVRVDRYDALLDIIDKYAVDIGASTYSSRGYAPLHVCAEYVPDVNMPLGSSPTASDYETQIRRVIEVMELLLRKGANINAGLVETVYGKNTGVTPLMAAVGARERYSSGAGNAQLRLVEWLIENGADPKATDSEGRSIANHINGYILGHCEKEQEFFRRLVSWGVDLEHPEPSGKTLTTMFMEAGEFNCARQLVSLRPATANSDAARQ